MKAAKRFSSWAMIEHVPDLDSTITLRQVTYNIDRIMTRLMNKDNWWAVCDNDVKANMEEIWIPVGCPGYAGGKKRDRKESLDRRFGQGCWRVAHFVRGRILSKEEAILEYEESYRVYLKERPELVRFLARFCGNVYDYHVDNVHDADYDQPHTSRSHYQDISVRKIMAEFVRDDGWPEVRNTGTDGADLVDLTDGSVHRIPRAEGFDGGYLLQIRGPESPGFFLNPAVVPVHDPALITSNPNVQGWFLGEGCGHLSVEAFWQSSKVIQVRYDKFLELKGERSSGGIIFDL